MNGINVPIFATTVAWSGYWKDFTMILVPALVIGLCALWFGMGKEATLQTVRQLQRFFTIMVGLLLTYLLTLVAFRLRNFAIDKATIEFEPMRELMWWMEFGGLLHVACWVIPLIGFGIAASWLLGQVARDRQNRDG